MNCARFRFECPGYPEDNVLVFRSENQTAMTKVEKRVASKLRIRSRQEQDQQAAGILNESERSTSTELQDVIGGSRCSPVYELMAPLQLANDIDDHALAFFHENFLAVGTMPSFSPSNTHSRREEKILVEGLENSMRAVALASMANFTRSPELSIEARKRYSLAVKKCNEAMSSPEVAQDDMLLSTILTLNTFEGVGGPDQQSLVDWANHAYGAAAILKLRGSEQLQTEQGQLLFIAAISLILAAIIREDRQVPKHVIELTEQASAHVSSEVPLWQWMRLKVRFVRFCTTHINVWPLVRRDINPSASLCEAYAIDAAIQDLSITRGRKYCEFYEIDAPQLSEYCFDGRCIVYRYFFAATVWNDVRTHRIILHGIIKHLLQAEASRIAKLPGSTNQQGSSSTVIDPGDYVSRHKASEDIQFQLSADILATVPQHLGLATYDEGLQQPGSILGKGPLFNFPWRSFETSSFTPMDWSRNTRKGVPIIRVHGGYTLHWGLLTLVKVREMSTEVRLKVAKLLRLIGLPQGNYQAAVFADALKVEGTNF